MENENVQEEVMPQETAPQEPVTQEPTQEIQAVSKDSSNMAMLCHLLAIFTGFVGPLIIWLIKKDSDKFVDNQGKEALNFQITVIFAFIVCGLLTIIVIGAFLWPVVGILNLIFCIMGAISASSGKAYKYPISIRLLK